MIWIKIWILAILAILSAADIRKMIIPDVCVLLMLPAALFAAEPWKPRLISVVAVWVCFVLIAAISALFKSDTPIGMGDIKLFSAIALISGPAGLAASAVLSSLAGGIYASALLITKKARKKDQIAFGPFIAVFYALYLASISAM